MMGLVKSQTKILFLVLMVFIGVLHARNLNGRRGSRNQATTTPATDDRLSTVGTGVRNNVTVHNSLNGTTADNSSTHSSKMNM